MRPKYEEPENDGETAATPPRSGLHGPITAPLSDHASALRSLARSLTADAQTADDWVQAAMIKGIERSPAPAPRRWLARVVTNLAREDWRRKKRRRSREEKAAARESQPSTVDLIVRHDVRMAMMESIRGLREPYRQAILLRYFEGLPPRKIARQLGVPVKTVNSRLHRALEQLRSHLDDEHDGDRGAWMAACLPLIQTTTTTTLTTGILVMSTKALGAALLALIAVWMFLIREPTVGITEPNAPGTPAPTSTIPAAEMPPPTPTRQAAGPLGFEPEMTPRRHGGDPSLTDQRTVARGQVRDMEGHPVPSASLIAIADSNSTKPRSLRSDSDGLFDLPLDDSGWTITCDDPKYAAVLDARATKTSGTAKREYLVIVARRETISGRVVDSELLAIDNADVELILPEEARARISLDLSHTEPRSWATTTDDQGRFSFEQAPRIDGLSCRAVATGAEPESLTLQNFPAHDLLLTLRTPGLTASLAGVIYGKEGLPKPGVRVGFGTMPDTTDEMGRFSFEYDPTAPPERIVAVTRGLAPAILERGDVPWPPSVELSFLDPPMEISGIVFGPNGLPATNAQVWLASPTVFASYDRDFWVAEVQIAGRGSLQHGSMTDEHGRFRIDGLMDQQYALKAILHHSAWQIDAGTYEAGEENAEIRFPRNGVHSQLNGRVIHTSGVPVPGARVFVETMMLAVEDPTSNQRFYNSQQGSHAMTDSDGHFTLEDVPKNASIGVSGSGLVFGDPVAVPTTLTEPLVIRVSKNCTFRVQINNLARAHSFALEDSGGTRINMIRRTAKRITYLLDAPIADGQSEVLTAPDSASTLLLMDDGGEEIHRTQVTLAPGPMNVIP